MFQEISCYRVVKEFDACDRHFYIDELFFLINFYEDRKIIDSKVADFLTKKIVPITEAFLKQHCFRTAHTFTNTALDS